MRLPYNGNYKTTQSFNDSCCRASYARFGMSGHNGIDYGLPCGTPVVAAHAGKVYTGVDPNGYGNYIFITGSTGDQTVYAHLKNLSVANGSQVSEGQQIGLSGTTGNSSGCHLHFGFRPKGYNNNNGFLGYIDPQQFIRSDEVTQAEYDALKVDRDNAYRVAEERLATLKVVQNDRNNAYATAEDRLKKLGILQTDRDNAYATAENRLKTINELKAQLGESDEANLLGRALLKVLATLGYKRG